MRVTSSADGADTEVPHTIFTDTDTATRTILCGKSVPLLNTTNKAMAFDLPRWAQVVRELIVEIQGALNALILPFSLRIRTAYGAKNQVSDITEVAFLPRVWPQPLQARSSYRPYERPAKQSGASAV